MPEDELRTWQRAYAEQKPSAGFVDRVMKDIDAQTVTSEPEQAYELKRENPQPLSRRMLPWLLVTGASLVACLRIGSAFWLWTM